MRTFTHFKLLWIFSIVFSANSTAQKTYWETLNVPAAERYDDVFFLNEDLGYTINSSGKVYNTNNGGLLWNELANLSGYLRGVEFIDENIGFVGSLDSALFKTTDGGNTWNNITNDLNSPFPIPGICAISIANNQVYVGGKWSGPAYIFKSGDGGQNWQYIGLDSLSRAIVEINFINDSIGFAAGKSNIVSEGGVILKTTNSGKTWRKVATTQFNNEFVWKIDQVHQNHWAASIQSNPAQTKLRYLTSNNFGETWQIQTVTDTFFQAQVIGFKDSATGWLGGLNHLFETTDGGLTWTQNNFGASYNRYFQVTDSLAFMSGEKVYRHTNKTKSTNQISTPVNLHLKAWRANQQIHVSFQLPQASFTECEIIDLQGNIVKIVLHSFLPKGDYALAENVQNLTPGIYFIILHTNYGLHHIPIAISEE